MAKLIKAAKYSQVEQVFAAINRRMLKSHFHQIWAKDFLVLKELDRQQPVIFYANHSNWWDGLIVFYICRDLLKLDGYLMMLARQLRKYSFFRWIGAFSVDRDSPISAFRSLQYAASLLNEGKPRRSVWIFPQGELLPNDVRPLTFLRGLGWLVENVPQAQVVAVTFRYEFMQEQLPEVFLSFQRRNLTKDLGDEQSFITSCQNDLTQQLDQLKELVVQQQLREFEPILAGRTSLNMLYERVLKLFQSNKLG